MKRIVLFTFKSDFDMCLNRIELIRKLNPHASIYGIFDGPERDLRLARETLSNVLEDVYYHAGRSAVWRWVNQDLVIRAWYNEVGKQLDFDMLHYIESDLVLFASLEEIFSGILKGSLGLTGLTPIDTIENKWAWTARDPFRTDWLDLIEDAIERCNYKKRPYACFGVGSCLPRGFLDRYSSTTVPELSNNEARMPLYAQILGYELRDNGLSKGIICDEAEYRVFNSKRRPDGRESEIELEDIITQISMPTGRRAFHPYYKPLDIDEILGRLGQPET